MELGKRIAFIILTGYLCYLLIAFHLTNRQETKTETENKSDRKNWTEILKNTHNMRQYIYETNDQQQVLNLDTFQKDFDLVIAVQVHNRSEYLQELINSLEAAPSINTTLIIFSHDIVDQNVYNLVQNITFAKVMQIFYPLSVQTHPDTFPGPDTNPSRDASKAQIKHHWWWKLNFIFAKVKILRQYQGLVLFLEEDHYVAPDFIHCLKMMDKFKRYSCDQCWFLALGRHGHLNFEMSNYVIVQSSVENLGLAFNRTVWTEILNFSEIFCKFDDYNWDWSLRHLVQSKFHAFSVIMTAARAFHFGKCGVHFNEDDCNASEEIQWYRSLQTNLFPDTLYAIDSDFFDSFEKNGGWGDQDQDMCMGMSDGTKMTLE